MLSKFKYASFLTYCPRTENNEEIKESKNIMLKLKNEQMEGNPPMPMSEWISEKIKENLENLPFKGFFGKEVSLVPVPKSSLMKPDSLWVPSRIAKALSEKGLGIYSPYLKRFKAVPKAAYSKSNQRPTARDHFESVRVKAILNQPEKIVLIDDVITRGSTMLGCASVLKEYFPKTTILGFAVIRTISDPHEFKSILDPCVGEIGLYGEDTFRTP